eukprot:1159324-Pelagomonas_calceolata.AAC.3
MREVISDCRSGQCRVVQGWQCKGTSARAPVQSGASAEWCKCRVVQGSWKRREGPVRVTQACGHQALDHTYTPTTHGHTRVALVVTAWPYAAYN